MFSVAYVTHTGVLALDTEHFRRIHARLPQRPFANQPAEGRAGGLPDTVDQAFWPDRCCLRGTWSVSLRILRPCDLDILAQARIDVPQRCVPEGFVPML